MYLHQIFPSLGKNAALLAWDRLRGGFLNKYMIIAIYHHFAGIIFMRPNQRNRTMICHSFAQSCQFENRILLLINACICVGWIQKN
jgi:hypothetical protein